MERSGGLSDGVPARPPPRSASPPWPPGPPPWPPPPAARSSLVAPPAAGRRGCRERWRVDDLGSSDALAVRDTRRRDQASIRPRDPRVREDDVDALAERPGLRAVSVRRVQPLEAKLGQPVGGREEIAPVRSDNALQGATVHGCLVLREEDRPSLPGPGGEEGIGHLRPVRRRGVDPGGPRCRDSRAGTLEGGEVGRPPGPEPSSAGACRLASSGRPPPLPPLPRAPLPGAFPGSLVGRPGAIVRRKRARTYPLPPSPLRRFSPPGSPFLPVGGLGRPLEGHRSLVRIGSVAHRPGEGRAVPGPVQAVYPARCVIFFFWLAG